MSQTNQQNDTLEPAARPFVVVLKGQSGVRFSPDSGVRLFLPTDGSTAEVRVRTDWVEAGLDHAIPRELLIEVRAEAPTVDNALALAQELANAVVPVIAFATNVQIDRVEPRIAFETTPGASERDLVEYFVPSQGGLLTQSRAADAELVGRTAEAVFSAASPKRLGAALAQYHQALDSYHLGGETLAVAHLFMAAEALCEPILAEHIERTGRSETQLMEDHGCGHRGDLLAWTRRELVFGGESSVHKKAKHASDGFEHGYLSIGEVRNSSREVCDDVFRLVREAIATVLRVDDGTRSALLDAFGKPGDTKSLRRRVVGKLIGEGTKLAQDGHEYPVLEWRSSITHFDLDASGEPIDVRFSDRFTVRTADDIAFQLRSMELYGRALPPEAVGSLEVDFETQEQAVARDRVLPTIREIHLAVAQIGPGAEGDFFSTTNFHLLEIFNRTKGLFAGALALLEGGLPEEAMILGRPMLRDATRLVEAAAADEALRVELAFGWRSDSLAATRSLIESWASSDGELTDRKQRATDLEASMVAAARRAGAERARSFAAAPTILETLDDEDYARLDQLASLLEQGWDVSTRSRRRTDASGKEGLHDTAPDSWMYPLAAKYIGGAYLLAADAACTIFGWGESEPALAKARQALESLEAGLT
ncbi:MAG: hypothetical protein AAF547_06205 [Actinomycetota bacterium]